MDESAKKELARMYKSLLVIYNTHKNLGLGDVLAFLSVAIKEGQYQAEIGTKLEMGQSTISRNLAEFKEYTYKKEPGLRWIEERQDYTDYSVKKLYLTRKGVQIINRILNREDKEE